MGFHFSFGPNVCGSPLMGLAFFFEGCRGFPSLGEWERVEERKVEAERREKDVRIDILPELKFNCCVRRNLV